ncbi:hypothetical protein CVS40_11913 [Lucilia cuprina]|nr:hypothetical protein CVS40_11913 [Lucilia cuprina]
MPQYLLSKLEYIFPVAFISSKDLKINGNERTFYHLAEELKKLEEGIEIDIGGEIRKVYFILGLVIGDNLAVNSILGFVQSFNSKRYCRVCKRTKTEMQCDTSEFPHYLRNRLNYQEDLEQNDFQETGIKNVCIFENIKSFYVSDNFCFDIMHDVLEGVCVYDVCNVLLGLINDKVVSLDDINREIEIGNTSIPLDYNRLKKFNLKMTASEVSCFVHLLPLMIGDLIPSDNKDWEVFISLLQIFDLIFKTSYEHEDITKLEELIKNHHSLYTKLYGPLKPKHHFLVHYPTAIRRCGSLKYHWSMRFEAKHKEAKMYFNNTTSRLNPCFSLALKAGLKFSSFLLKQVF